MNTPSFSSPIPLPHNYKETLKKVCTFFPFAANIQMAVLPKVRSALCAASQLPGEGPTDVEDSPAPAS